MGGSLRLSLSLAVKFLLAAGFFHFSLFLRGFLTGLLPSEKVRFLFFAGSLGLGLAGLLAFPLLRFQLCPALGFRFMPFCFQTRAIGLGLSLSIDFCLALCFVSSPLGFLLSLPLLFFGELLRFQLCLAIGFRFTPLCFQTRVLGLSLLLRLDFCLALCFGASPLGFLLSLAFLLFGEPL